MKFSSKTYMSNWLPLTWVALSRRAYGHDILMIGGNLKARIHVGEKGLVYLLIWLSCC